MTDIGYSYLLYITIPEAFNLEEFMLKLSNPMAIFVEALLLDEIREDPYTYMNLIDYFARLDFAAMFEESTPVTQQIIKVLERQRREINYLFLMDPFDPCFENADYFRFVGQFVSDIWDCKNITAKNLPEVGDRLIAEKSIFLDRLHKFTCGVLEKSPNPKIGPDESFPWENVILAGGSVTQLLEADAKIHRASDVDIFIYGPNYKACAGTFNKVIRWFSSPDTYYAVKNSVVYIYIVDIQRSFQIINTNFGSPYDVLDRFDMTHIQWGVYHAPEDTSMVLSKLSRSGLSVVGTTQAFRAMKSKISQIWNPTNSRVFRFIKTMYRGYSIEKNKQIESEKVDIESLINNKRAINEIIRDIHTFYYPTSANLDGMSADEKDNYILGMIKLHTRANFMSKSVSDIVNNVIIYGNFDSNYDSMGFAAFRSDVIVFTGGPRGRLNTIIKDRFGVIYLMSDIMEIKSMTNNDRVIIINCHKISQAFAEFLENLEEKTFHIYSRQRVTDKINKNGVVTFKYSLNKLAVKTERGQSCVRDKNGEPLNIEEDISAGDLIQVVFNISVEIQADVRKMKLDPVKIIRVERKNKGDTEIVRENIEELANAKICKKKEETNKYSDINIDF